MQTDLIQCPICKKMVKRKDFIVSVRGDIPPEFILSKNIEILKNDPNVEIINLCRECRDAGH